MPEQAIEAPDLSRLLTLIKSDYPDLSFTEAVQFSWHAGRKIVSFKTSEQDSDQVKNIWALLHELGHALLGHTNYRYDFELLKLEAEAWAKGHELASRYAVTIDEEYVQDCLDTYRDWLHLRATCPTCYGRSLQTSPKQYSCFNCQAKWTVSRNRFCRPYRLQTFDVA